MANFFRQDLTKESAVNVMIRQRYNHGSKTTI